MDIRYSAIRAEHLPSFYRLCRSLKAEQAGVSFARVLTECELQEWLENPRVYLYGAFDGDRLIGAFKAERGETGKEHSCYIAGAVLRDYRGHGIGRQLLEFGMEQLLKQGVWLIRAKVYSTNTASIATLLSAGFTCSGAIYKHQWDEKRQRYIDDLIFHKELK